MEINSGMFGEGSVEETEGDGGRGGIESPLAGNGEWGVAHGYPP